MIMHLYHNIRFAILKRKIKKNPYIGKEAFDGTYNYEQGSYDIRYRIIKGTTGKESIDWISQRRRLGTYEERIKRLRKVFFNFWHYQGWFIFFRPPIIFILFTSVLIFYFGLIESQKTKVERFKWIVASVVGVSPHQIEYIGDGSLEISTQRKTAVDKVYEPVIYRVNPFRWFFSSETGFVSRWRGESYGYVTHPVVYNERGEVWLNKEGNWLYGRISGKEVKWDVPQGTGIRAGKVAGHEISTQDKKLYIQDK